MRLRTWVLSEEGQRALAPDAGAASRARLQAELQQLLAVADVDGDGLIDYNEFVAATMHISKLEKEELLQVDRVWSNEMFV